MIEWGKTRSKREKKSRKRENIRRMRERIRKKEVNSGILTIY